MKWNFLDDVRSEGAVKVGRKKRLKKKKRLSVGMSYCALLVLQQIWRSARIYNHAELHTQAARVFRFLFSSYHFLFSHYSILIKLLVRVYICRSVAFHTYIYYIHSM